METKRDNITLALILSLLVCLLGSVVWGAIYYAGFFAAYIALLEVFVAGIVYSKFKKLNWFGILWIAVLTILFNEFSMLAVNVLVISNEFGFTISQSTELLIKLMQENQEVSSAFVSDSLSNFLFTFIGIVIYSVSYFKGKKTQRTQPANVTTPEQKPQITPTPVVTPVVENKQPTVKNLETQTKFEDFIPELKDINYIYKTLTSELNKIIQTYKSDLNKDNFKLNLKELRETKIQTLNATEKAELKNIIELEISKITDAKTLKNLNLLLTLIK